ncbi:hypothetical protein ACU6YH_21715 [Klebsiella aerogenes]
MSYQENLPNGPRWRPDLKPKSSARWWVLPEQIPLRSAGRVLPPWLSALRRLNLRRWSSALWPWCCPRQHLLTDSQCWLSGWFSRAQQGYCPAAIVSERQVLSLHPLFAPRLPAK